MLFSFSFPAQEKDLCPIIDQHHQLRVLWAAFPTGHTVGRAAHLENAAAVAAAAGA